MKNRIVGLLLAVMAGLGLVATAGVAAEGTASAAVVRDQGSRVFVGFTKAETKQLARTGVVGVLDNPAVRQYWYLSIDSKTRLRQVYVPGRGLLTYGTANKIVREAASHNGNVWISFNKTGKRPLTLWTRW